MNPTIARLAAKSANFPAIMASLPCGDHISHLCNDALNEVFQSGRDLCHLKTCLFYRRLVISILLTDFGNVLVYVIT